MTCSTTARGCRSASTHLRAVRLPFLPPVTCTTADCPGVTGVKLFNSQREMKFARSSAATLTVYKWRNYNAEGDEPVEMNG